MRRFAVATFLAMLVAGCRGDQGGESITELLDDDPVTRGFVCTTAPTTAFGPGYVYRQDPAGSLFYVSLLTDQVRVDRFPTELGTRTAARVRGGGLKFQLGPQISGVTGGVDASASASRNTLVTFIGSDLVQMTDAEATNMVSLANAGLTPVSDNSYFVVRDVIQARGMEIKLSSADKASLDADVGVGQIGTVAPNFTVDDSSGLDLKGVFDPPRNVCMRAVSFVPVSGGQDVVSGGTRWELTEEFAPAADIAAVISR